MEIGYSDVASESLSQTMEKIKDPTLFQLQFFTRPLEVLNRLGLVSQ
jgi:hypothetical protein